MAVVADRTRVEGGSAAAVDVSNEEGAILVMGATGAGKSTFINLLSGSTTLNVGDGLKSLTKAVQTAQVVFMRRRLTLIDTPGFDDTSISNFDIVREIATYLTQHYGAGKKVHGVIYLHRISDNRLAGSSRTTFDMVMKLCGKERMGHLAIVTTMWDNVPKDVAVARERQLKTDELMFSDAILKGAKFFRHDAGPQSSRAVLLYLVKKRQISLLIQDELVNGQKRLADTTVGRALRSEMDVLIAKHEQDLADLQADMAAAMEAKDIEAKAELEQARQELKLMIDSLRSQDSEGSRPRLADDERNAGVRRHTDSVLDTNQRRLSAAEDSNRRRAQSLQTTPGSSRMLDSDIVMRLQDEPINEEDEQPTSDITMPVTQKPMGSQIAPMKYDDDHYANRTCCVIF